MITIPRDLLPGRSVVGVQRVDTDSDGSQEWVAFYRFDQVAERGPVAALIYDVVYDPDVQLPIVYPYRLRTPNQTYLAQTEPRVLTLDLMTEIGRPSTKELAFQTAFELVFFQLARQATALPSDDPPLYRCVGFFRSDEGVSFDVETNQVTVTSRTGYERSQLVTKHVYLPTGDGYFVAGTGDTVQPVDSYIAFPRGIPNDILDTPYPEKIVLAFYSTLGQAQPDTSPSQYLTTLAALEFASDTLRFGSVYSPDQLVSAVVKEISYYPTQEDSQSTLVTIRAVFHAQVDGQDVSSPLMEVTWTMSRIEGRWKMDRPQP